MPGQSENDGGRNLGAYRLLDTLGSGGMGVVYAAWDSRLERRVALKMIHRHLLSDPLVSERFLREAKAAARIEHPNVVRVYRVESIGEELAIEMQFIEGRPLSALIGSSPFPNAHTVYLMRQILDALSACHGQGVIHCDLKPGNLLITESRQVFLTDFGIARALEKSGVDATVQTARSGPYWGTPRYSPPEAWDGATPDASWDLYALGVLTYEILTGQPAFDGNTPAALMRQILAATPRPLGTLCPELSPEFLSLIADLMAPDPARRPASAKQALDRLLQSPECQGAQADTQPLPVCGHLDLPGSGSEVEARAGRSTTKRRWLAGLMLAAAACAIAVAAFRGPHNPPEAATPPGEAKPLPAADRELPEHAGTTASTLPEPGELTPASNGVLFAYDDGVHGAELWFASAPDTAKLVRDLAPGPTGSYPRGLFASSDQTLVLFAATTPDAGEELWVSRVLVEGEFDVYRLKDIMPGEMGSEPQVIGALQGFFIFYATSLLEGRELWMTNTHAAQTARIRDVFPGVGGSTMMTPRMLFDARGFYFLAQDDSNRGQLLHRYDHATHYIQLISDVFEDAGSMGLAGDTLVLANRDSDHGVEPWVYRPSDARFERLADLNPGSASSNPGEITGWKGRVYFSAHTDAAGKEIWVTDGTAIGTMLLADLNPGVAGSDPYAFVDGGDHLLFRATTAEFGQELWMTDGTASGTRLVADLWPGPNSGGPYNVVAANDRVFFTAREPNFGEELYVHYFGEDGARLVADLWPGAQGSEPYELTVTGRASGLFRFRSPELGPSIAVINWAGAPPVVTSIDLPHASDVPK